MILEKVCAVGSHQCTMRLTSEGGFACTWSGSVPRRLSKPELDSYLQFRNSLVAEMAEKLGTLDRLTGCYRFSLWQPENVDWRAHASNRMRRW